MKDYVEQLERLGFVLPQDLSVGLILNGLTSDFIGFVRNYNMHNMRKTIGELHVMLIEYEKGKMTRKSFPYRPERATDLLGIIHTDVCGPLIHVPRQGYPKETMGYYFYFPSKNKIVVARYAEFFERNLITQEVSGRAIDLEKIQDEDTSPFEITSKIPMEVEGFVDPNHAIKVCKRQRSIYGLKQASRSWNKRFDEEIKRFGFAQNLDEPCVYQKASRSNVTFLILYVDDIIIIKNHILSLQSVKDYLGKCFAMKDLGEAAFILGIKIYRDSTKRLIKFGQNAYMDKILKRYKWINPNVVISPCKKDLI
nr:putative retrotransposon protein [Tanacetum cinerariifolium]